MEVLVLWGTGYMKKPLLERLSQWGVLEARCTTAAGFLE